MTKSRKFKILSVIIMTISGLLLAFDFFQGEANFFDFYLHGGMLLVGAYFLFLAKKQSGSPKADSNRKTISLKLFAVSSGIGLVFTVLVLYNLRHYPIWSIGISIGIIIIFLIIVIFTARRRGYLQ